MHSIRNFVGTLAVAFVVSVPAVADHHGHGTGDNIVETARAAGQFETLLAAASAAGLAPALSADGPFTVFAPTDDAFGALPAGTVETLLRNENRDRLESILELHVVQGRVGSEALEDGAALETLAGPRVSVTETEQGFTIEGARIVATDIEASNGIVHVIDRVILPQRAMSRAEAGRTIERAIRIGVPRFNHGDPEATARIYADAARTLLESARLSTSERNRLQRGLSAGEHSASARESAWQLRYALDDVFDSLHRADDMLASARSMRR